MRTSRRAVIGQWTYWHVRSRAKDTCLLGWAVLQALIDDAKADPSYCIYWLRCFTFSRSRGHMALCLSLSYRRQSHSECAHACCILIYCWFHDHLRSHRCVRCCVLPCNWDVNSTKLLWKWMEMWSRHGHQPTKAVLVMQTHRIPVNLQPDLLRNTTIYITW